MPRLVDHPPTSAASDNPAAAKKRSERLKALGKHVLPKEESEDGAEQVTAILSGAAAHGGCSRGMVLPFQALSLTFRHVHYYVPMPKVVVCFISGKGSRRRWL